MTIVTGTSAVGPGLAGAPSTPSQRLVAPRHRPLRRPAASPPRRDPLGTALTGPFTVPLPAEPGPFNEITVRPAGFHDSAVLRTIFVEGRADDFTDLPPQLVASLLEMQHAAHLRSRRRDWPGAVDYLLEHRGVPCGRLTVDAGTHLRVLDLSLLPGSRGRQRGRTVLRTIARRAVDHDRTIRFRLRVDALGSGMLADLDARVVAVSAAGAEIEVRG